MSYYIARIKPEKPLLYFEEKLTIFVLSKGALLSCFTWGRTNQHAQNLTSFIARDLLEPKRGRHENL